MIAAFVGTGLLGVGALALWATFYYAPARHSGGGEGALTVAYLVARVRTEASSSGRRRMRDQIAMRGDLADVLADESTAIQRLPHAVLAAHPHEFARNPLVLQRVHAGLQRL